jgi:hypothetical protein
MVSTFHHRGFDFSSSYFRVTTKCSLQGPRLQKITQNKAFFFQFHLHYTLKNIIRLSLSNSLSLISEFVILWTSKTKELKEQSKKAGK